MQSYIPFRGLYLICYSRFHSSDEQGSLQENAVDGKWAIKLVVSIQERVEKGHGCG